MSLRLPSFGVRRLPGSKPVELFRFIALFLLIILLVVLGYHFWHHGRQKSNGVVYKPTSINTLEQGKNKASDQYLSNKDYSSYQYNEVAVANEYLGSRDTADAERVMNDVMQKVPSGKVVSATYAAWINIGLAKKDNEMVKKYEKLYIAQLRTEGDNKGADAQQKYLDSLK